jgi:hypothetical protein
MIFSVGERKLNKIFTVYGVEGTLTSHFKILEIYMYKYHFLD